MSETTNADSRRYTYEQGSNRLRAIHDSHATAATPAVYYYDATGNHLTHHGWRYEYAGARPTGAYRGQRVIRYRYNSLGERIEKTVYQKTHGHSARHTTYYLYDNKQLVAEANEQGTITAQYLYAGQRPIAVLQGKTIYAIHTDHLGTPQAVTDPNQTIVWQAAYEPFGRAHVNADPDRDGKPFTLNLRLPGQYYDEETETHYNYARDYDPRTGRYLTPDPLGIEAGVNPYTYVSNDPLQKIDLYGTYEIDIHYYMTYFLARLAGISAQEAYTIALASQYIDDNPATEPLNLGSEHITRLETYHFTQRIGHDPLRTQEEQNFYLARGREAISYIERRFINPWNPQLDRLLNALNNAPTRCARAQFFGEFLHTYQDTFSHRNPENAPIDLNFGIGHGLYGHDPDKTYNHGRWVYNELRTLQMEREAFARLLVYSAKQFINPNTGRAVTITDLAGDGSLSSDGILQRFNREQDVLGKIMILDEALQQFGLGPIPAYDMRCAQAKRNEYLGGLVQDQYPGTILPTTTGAPGSSVQTCNG